MKGSPYIAWAKSRLGIRYNLAASGVRPCPAELLEPTLDDFTLGGAYPEGWPPLIARIARRYGVAESQVVLAHGCSMANHLVFAALLEPGDDVLVEQPSYEPLAAVPRYLGAVVRGFSRAPEDGWRLDAERIAAVLTPRTRMVVLSNLHNPTGALTGESELRALGALAAERGIHVLVDEVYLEWLHDDGMPSAARLGAPFIATGSLTKAYGLDWLRAGWVLAPPDVAQRIRRVQDLFSGHIAQPTQRLAAKALDRASRLLAPLQALVGRNRDLVDRFVRAHERLSWVRPVAGAVGFVHLRDGSVDELVERLETRYDTTVAPGRFFGMPTWFRIGFGMDTAVLEEGLVRLAAALAK
ncbi:MAG: aminotransferase class I/II-fold pyridoxal phosphate-dependent enzyme [bacterium]